MMPAVKHTVGDLNHDFSISGQSRGMKGGLDQLAPLAPELAIAQQQTLPLELAKYLFYTWGLVEAPRLFDENFVNVIGMGYLGIPVGATAIIDDVAVFIRQLSRKSLNVLLKSSDKIQSKKVALWPRWIARIHANSHFLRSARYHAR